MRYALLNKFNGVFLRGKPVMSVKGTREVQSRAWAKDESDADAGRVISHETIITWLRF